MALCTAVQVRLAGVPQITGTDEDSPLITPLILQAEQAIARWLCFPMSDAGTYTLETATYTLYVDEPHPSRPSELVLPMRPLVTVTSVHRSVERTYDASTLVASADYTSNLGRGVLIAAYGTTGWYTGYRAQKVIVTAGLGTAGSGQSSIITAVALQMAYTLQQRRTGPALTNASGGGQSAAFAAPSGIEPRAMALLRPWQLTEKQVG